MASRQASYLVAKMHQQEHHQGATETGSKRPRGRPPGIARLKKKDQPNTERSVSVGLGSIESPSRQPRQCGVDPQTGCMHSGITNCGSKHVATLLYSYFCELTCQVSVYLLFVLFQLVVCVIVECVFWFVLLCCV